MRRALFLMLILVSTMHALAPLAHAWPYFLDCPCRKYRTLTNRIADKAEEATDYYAMAKGVWDPPLTAEQIKGYIELAVEAQKEMLAIQQQRAKLLAMCDEHKHLAATCTQKNHK